MTQALCERVQQNMVSLAHSRCAVIQKDALLQLSVLRLGEESLDAISLAGAVGGGVD